MDSIDELLESTIHRFESRGYEVDEKLREDLRAHLEYSTEFSVPFSELSKIAENFLARKLGVDRSELVQKDAPLVKIGELADPDEWVSVKVKVARLWGDKGNDAISQAGIAGDETGTIKFVIWSSSGAPKVEEGKCYLFKNVVTDFYKGRIQINITKSSSIEEIDEKIELKQADQELRGVLVSVSKNSGLIKRCPECLKTTAKGICPTHGKVEIIRDLRVIGVLDDGEDTHTVVMDKNVVAKLSGITLDDAIKMAKETLDSTTPLKELKKRMIGRYYSLKGYMGTRYFVVKDGDSLVPELSRIKNILEMLSQAH